MSPDERRGTHRRRGGEAAARARPAAGELLALNLEHRRRQRLHPLQPDHRDLLRADPLAGVDRRRGLRPDRDRQLLHRHPPGAEGEADAGRAGGARRPPRQGRARRRARQPRGRGGRAGRRGRDRARRPARRRRRNPRQPRDDAGRVAADRRGRRGAQGRRRPRPLRLLLHLRLRPLPGRRGARAELRRQAGRRGARLPPPALAAPGGGQPGDRRLHLGDAALGRRCCCSPSSCAAPTWSKRRRRRPPAW